MAVSRKSTAAFIVPSRMSEVCELTAYCADASFARAMLQTTLHYNAPVTKVTSSLYLYSRTQSAAAVSPTVPSDLPAAPQAASKFLRELGTSGLSVSIANICTLPMGEQQQLLKMLEPSSTPLSLD